MEYDFQSFLLTFFCYYFRFLALFYFSPLSSLIPSNLQKLQISIVVCLALLPDTYHAHDFLIVTLIAEFLFGALLIIPACLLFEFLVASGDLLDAQRGQTIALQYNPLVEGIESILAQMFRLILVAVTVQAGLVEKLVVYFSTSLLTKPIGEISFKQILLITLDIWSESLNAVVSGFAFIFPLLALLLIVDIYFIFIQLTVPNCSLSSETFLIKTIIALVCLWIMLNENIFLYWIRLTFRQVLNE